MGPTCSRWSSLHDSFTIFHKNILEVSTDVDIILLMKTSSSRYGNLLKYIAEGNVLLKVVRIINQSITFIPMNATRWRKLSEMQCPMYQHFFLYPAIGSFFSFACRFEPFALHCWCPVFDPLSLPAFMDTGLVQIRAGSSCT